MIISIKMRRVDNPIEFRDNIRKELQANDFIILNRAQQLNDIYTQINILALKTIQINEFLQTICIVPIKLCPIKGSLIVSENKIDYKPINQNQKKNYENLQRYAKVLTHTYEKLSDDIANQGSFLSLLNKYLKLNLSLEKTLTHKNLFFSFVVYGNTATPAASCDKDLQAKITKDCVSVCVLNC